MRRLRHLANHLSTHDQRADLQQTPCNAAEFIPDNQIGRGRKVAIIGSGVIGRNWAVLFGRAGFSVCMYDIKQTQLTAAEHDLRSFRVPLLEKYAMLFGSE